MSFVVEIPDCFRKNDRVSSGWGQPSDQAKLEIRRSGSGEAFVFVVENVKMDRESKIVWHSGYFEEGGGGGKEKEVEDFSKEEYRARITIDADLRMKHSRIHSAGHLLDVAVANVRLTLDGGFVPTKGSYDTENAYVDYKGNARSIFNAKKDGGVSSSNISGGSDANVEETDRALIKGLNEELSKLIERDDDVKFEYMSYEKAKEACGGFIPEYISTSDVPRNVIIGNGLGCPCGGTHVENTKLLGEVKVTGVRVKKGSTRISYEVCF